MSPLKISRIVMIALSLLLVLPACSGRKKAQRRQKTSTLSRPPSSSSGIQNKYAEILGVPANNIKNTRLYHFIDDWSGTSYQYGGMSRSGVDCSGFVNLLFQEVYRKELSRTTSQLSKESKKLSKSQLREGDLVFFTISGKKNSHVGVYLQNNKFVHASSSKGVVISSLDSPYYQKNFSAGGRVI